MEARVEYLGRVERPRLTVVKDDGATGRFSALPHEVVFSDLTDGEVRMYAVVQSFAWGEGGECTANHATLAAKTGRKERTIRALLASLVAKGYLSERHHGRGQGKAYRPCTPSQSGRDLPVVSGRDLPVREPKRQESATPSGKNLPAKRQESAAPIEEDKKKKKQEEEVFPPATPPGAATRSGQLIDLFKAADIPVTLRPQDHKALKDSAADPSLVAEAYGAIFRGEWGDDFMRRSLSVQFVIGRLGGYLAWKHGPAPKAGNGRMPPGSASKQRSGWETFKGRHGGVVGGMPLEAKP